MKRDEGFTPGPFVMERDGASGRWSLCEVIVAGEGPVWIAEVRFSEYETKQTEIARLIAAAPDLLAVCMAYVSEHQCLGENEETYCGCKTMREVIAKATSSLSAAERNGR